MIFPHIGTAAIAAAAIFGTVFWQRPAESQYLGPSSMPGFGEVAPKFSMEAKNGSSVVSFTSHDSPSALLDGACAAYRSAGWKELPVRTADMRLFAKGESVAAVLVQTTLQGTCVTAIQRPRGL